jgi:phage FluMu protein gp41
MSVKGTLKHGFTIGGIAYTWFEMREPTTAELLDAEQGAPASQPLNFNAHLMALQLVEVSTADGGRKFTGPFTIGMIRNLKPADFWALRRAQQELDDLGERESGSGAASLNPSS